jgi:hypothetical protein
MTQKFRILALVFLTLALAMAGIGGAVAAHAAPTPASLAWSPTTSSGTYDYGTIATGATKSVTFTLTNASGKAASASLTLTGKAGVGGTPTLTLSPGRLLETVNGTNFYNYTYQPPSTDATQTFTVTNSGTSASKTLLIKCNDLPSSESCNYPFTITHDTCTNTSLAANGGNCTIDLEVTFSGTCQKGTPYSTELDMVGTDVTYLTLFAYALCPG